MSASKIGAQHGAEATRLRLNAIDPGKAGYDKLLGEPGKTYGYVDTLDETGAVIASRPAVAGETPTRTVGPVEGALRKTFSDVNELIDRVAALEAATPGPFFP